MAITSIKGRLGFKLQSSQLPQYSMSGDPSAAPVAYFPAGGGVLSHRATSINFGPTMDQRQLSQEIGGGIFPTGAYRTSYSGSGDFSIQPRLEGTLGWLLYAITGEVVGECENSTATVVEHNFIMPQGANAGNLPWVTLFKYLPGLGVNSDAVEMFEDGRLVGCNINMPAAGLPTMDFTARARLWGITGTEHFLDRSVLVGLDFDAWDTATGGTTATLVDSGAEWDVNEHADKYVYIAGSIKRWVQVVSNTATALTFSETLPTAVINGTPYAFGTVATSGNIKTVTVVSTPAAYTAGAEVNKFAIVRNRGTRRIKRNTTSTLYADGEFFSEVDAGDVFVLVPTVKPTSTSSDASTVVSTSLFANDDYLDYYIQVWDSAGNNLGLHKIIAIDANTKTATVDGTFAATPSVTCSMVLFGPMTDISWGEYEDMLSIPVTSEPHGYFKGLREPLDGDPLPVRQVRVNVQYQTLNPDQEMIIGAYEMNYITIQGATIELSYTQRIKNYDLYSAIMTTQNITPEIARFSAEVFRSDVELRVTSPASIPGASEPYSLEILFPDVVWEMNGSPRLSGGDVVELDFTGRVNIVEGNLTMLSEKTIASAGDVNAITGAITHADLDATALAGIGLTGNDFIGYFVRITSGKGAGQVRAISAYADGTSNGTITPHRNWMVTPDNTSNFVIERRYVVFQLVNNEPKYQPRIPAIP